MIETNKEFEAVIEDNIAILLVAPNRQVEALTAAGVYRAQGFLLNHPNATPNMTSVIKRAFRLKTLRRIAANLNEASGPTNARLSDGTPCGF